MTCLLLVIAILMVNFMSNERDYVPKRSYVPDTKPSIPEIVPGYEEPVFVMEKKKDSFVSGSRASSEHRIAIINTIFFDELSDAFLESLYTWGANDNILDYFLFTNSHGETYRKQVEEHLPNVKNIHIIDKYPGYGSDGFAFIREKMLQMLSEINMNPLPELDYDLSGKFCDIRPFFGDIFEDWIRSHTHWGWTDQHVYAGDLQPYLKEWLGAYDVITFAPPTGGGWRMYTTGRLSIFRNDKPYIKSYWKLTDKKTIYDKFHKNPGGIVADEWWFSMPVFNQKNISFVQSYVQSDSSRGSVWYRRCSDENKCTNHYLWKYKIEEYWYQDTLSMKAPERLDQKWDIGNYLQPWGDKKNLDMEKIAGYYNFYREDGEWFRAPMDTSIIVDYDPKTQLIVLEPKIVHARTALCQIKEADIDKFIHSNERNCLTKKFE